MRGGGDGGTLQGMTVEATPRIFRDRVDAGRALGAALVPMGLERPVVIGLPRGGVPVAYEVACALGAPLDVLVARKIGAPGNPEFAIGAVAEGGAQVLNREAVASLLIGHEELEQAVAAARAQVGERVRRYRQAAEPLPLAGCTAVVVDDGLATGATARAALRAVRARGPARVVLAVPVAAPDSVESLRAEADDVVAVQMPEQLWAIGFWYEAFDQTPDAEVEALLRRARAGTREFAAEADDPPAPPSRPVEIPAADVEDQLHGDLTVPADATGLVIFAHGSGSSRHSPRNRHVAAVLNRGGQATLLLDLLAAGEELDRRNVFDIPLLARRLSAATRWARGEPSVAALPIGYFGASTGAGAALWAAAQTDGAIRAVVSRGGRPDLAARRLGAVGAPVLLIVGGRDEIVLDLNRQAQEELGGPAELVVVAGATHLFEEPGALDEVARLATNWFKQHLDGY